MAFKGLRDETAAQGALHESVAKELQTGVAEPFEKWAQGHKVCLSQIVMHEASGLTIAVALGTSPCEQGQHT